MSTGTTLSLLTRLGFAARGLLYILIALVVLKNGGSSDHQEALRQAGQDGGGLLLGLMAAGFGAYGLWRLADATLNIEHHESSGKGTRERLGAAGSGLVHLALAWQAVRLLTGESGGSSSAARDTIGLPGGELLFILAGLVLIGVGIFQLVKAARASFCDTLDAEVAHRPWVKWMGRLGYSARGIVFLLSGWFVAGAGLHSDPSEAGGMDRALAWLDEPWNMVVAAGLLLFGLFSLVEARFRRIHAVPIDAMASAAAARIR